jgi:hypothetical protein
MPAKAGGSDGSGGGGGNSVGGKSGGGGGGGGGGGSSSPLRVSKERRRLVGNLLMCDVLCANTYVVFILAWWGLYKLNAVDPYSLKAPRFNPRT